MLSAAPTARYLGLDLDQGTHGGDPGALDHARELLAPFDAEIRVRDSQKADRLPEGVDLLHIDGDHGYQGCMSDLMLAYRSGVRYALVDDTDYIPEVGQAVRAFASVYGYWTATEFLHDGHRGMALIQLR